MTSQSNRATPSLGLDLRVEHWPLKEPFVIAGHSFDSSATVVATITSGGVSGRGEASGVYYRGETPDKMIEEIREAWPAIAAGATREALQGLMPPGGARNALDCAFWDLEAALSGQAVTTLAGLETARPLLTTWTIGVSTPDAMAERARSYVGVRAIKLKLVGDADDAARVRAVRNARPDVWLAVDANQGLTPDSLDRLWPALQDCGVALIEQPFPIGADNWLAGRDRSIPFAADESLQSLAELETLAPLYDVINIKLDKCGGLTEGLTIARHARNLGLKVMVGNMTGTSLGMAPALVLGQLCDVVDLDGPIFLQCDYNPGVHYDDGLIHIREPYWGAMTTATG